VERDREFSPGLRRIPPERKEAKEQNKLRALMRESAAKGEEWGLIRSFGGGKSTVRSAEKKVLSPLCLKPA